MTVQQEIVGIIQALDGIGTAFPPTNADGTANVAAQTAAVTGAINAAVAADAALFTSLGVSQSEAVSFALALLPIISAYKAATNRPTM